MSIFFSASEIFQFAIKIEENGEEFYRLIAEKTEAAEVKNIFAYLAGEEAKHKTIFQDMLGRVEKYEPPESYPDEYFAYLKAYASELVFTKEKKGQVMAGQMKTVPEAIEFGIRIEIDSILYYLEVKNLVPENQKTIIDKIVEEERRHYLKLLAVKKKW